MRNRILLVVLCAWAPGAAFAQVYATAELGYASADINLGAPYNGDIDDRSFTLGAEVGFSIRERFAIELGVTRFNSMDGRGTPCVPGTNCPLVIQPTSGNDILAYNLSLVPHVELADVELFAEIGYYTARIDTEIGLPDSDFRERGLLLGVGARWYFREPWSISLEASRFENDIQHITVGAGWGLRSGRERDGRPERERRRRSDAL